MEVFLEFKNIGNDIYCRRFAIGNISGEKIILSNWFWYISTECC